MLKSNSKLFMAKVLEEVKKVVLAEDGANLEECTSIMLENMAAGHKGEFGRYPAFIRPAVVSVPNMKYFIQSVGGAFEYCEWKQIEVLAGLYCENEAEKQAYIEKWERVLERKGYEPIVEHYSYIMYKGLVKLLKELNIKA